MNWKLASFVLVAAGATLLAVPGCAADSSDGVDEGAAEEEGSSQEELNANGRKLVGAFVGQGANHPPGFQGLVFKSDGSFLADIDTGIRCITTPCPSHERLEGTYTATKNYVRLSAKGSQSANLGRYRYTLQGENLTLSRGNWNDALTKETSYCAMPSDCHGQNLMQPKCIGSWQCGTSNECHYACGVRPATGVWPADATKLTSQSSGGGFTPPPPPGSTCGLGALKFELDVATKTLTYETCKFVSWQTPLTKQTGTKVLSATELASIVSAAKAVKVSTSDICGADKPVLTMTVTAPSTGTKTYKDSFYACNGNGTYVDGIDEVNSAFYAAAGLR